MVLEYQDPVSWRLLAEAQAHYNSNDFKYIEVPWLVPTEIMTITFKDNYRFKTLLGDPVASGEQSFLHLNINDKLDPGKYMTITPCFRDEEEDEYHKKQFMKLELYITEHVSDSTLHNTIELCREFFAKMIWKWPIIKVDMDDGSFDLCANDVELGSYGIREHEGLKWIYATGAAEPRLSQLRRKSLRA